MFLDIFVLILFFISALIAFLRGFIREALSLVNLGLAMAAGYFLGPYLAPLFEGWFGVEEGVEPSKLMGLLPMDTLADVLARGGIFLIVLLVLSLVTHIFAEFIKSIGLGAVDRSLGVIFGLGRAVLLIIVLYLPVHILVEDETKEDWFGKSKTHFYVVAGANWMTDVIPDYFFQDKIEATEESLQDNEVIKGAREKLQAMDLLRDDLTPEERSQLVREKLNNGDLKKAFEGEGYSDEFRNKLDSLVEDNMSDDLKE